MSSQTKEPSTDTRGDYEGRVLVFVSAKGGTGKTIVATSTAYLLAKAGKKVIAIDGDFSTRGLSLYLLGSVIDSLEAGIEVRDKNSLAEGVLKEIPVEDMTPIPIRREGIAVDLITSNAALWRGGVPDEAFLVPTNSQTDFDRVSVYASFLDQLCERFRKEYDYIIIDTRGGYDYSSAIPASLSDGYIMVLEADMISVEQVEGFMKAIQSFSESQSRNVGLSGFIVNKALFPIDDKVFSEELARRFHGKTFGTIPFDRFAPKAYQIKAIPLALYPDSDFSYRCSRTIENLVAPSVNWGSRDIANFQNTMGKIRVGWQAKQRLNRALTFGSDVSVPLLIAALALFVTSQLTPPGPLSKSLASTAYVGAAIFVIVTSAGLLVGALRRAGTKLGYSGRLVLSAGAVLLWVAVGIGAFWLVPRSLSDDVLQERIRAQNLTIGSTARDLAILSDKTRVLLNERNFLRTDANRAQAQLESQMKQSQLNAADAQKTVGALRDQLAALEVREADAQKTVSALRDQLAAEHRLSPSSVVFFKDLGVSSLFELNGVTVCATRGSLEEFSWQEFAQANSLDYKLVSTGARGARNEYFRSRRCDIVIVRSREVPDLLTDDLMALTIPPAL